MLAVARKTLFYDPSALRLNNSNTRVVSCPVSVLGACKIHKIHKERETEHLAVSCKKPYSKIYKKGAAYRVWVSHDMSHVVYLC